MNFPPQYSPPIKQNKPLPPHIAQHINHFKTMSTPTRTIAGTSLAALARNADGTMRSIVFSPQRLDAAAALTALFGDASTNNSTDGLVESPSETRGYSMSGSSSGRKIVRRGSVDAYATPKYMLAHHHEDNLSSSSSANDSLKRKFPVPDFFATPANQSSSSSSLMENGSMSESGRKTKKQKYKKRARTNHEITIDTSTGLSNDGGGPPISFIKKKPTKTLKQKKKKIIKNDDAAAATSSRKLKALGLLCARFIIMHYNDIPGSTEIKLSELSELMGIERRRMYDW